MNVVDIAAKHTNNLDLFVWSTLSDTIPTVNV